MNKAERSIQFNRLLDTKTEYRTCFMCGGQYPKRSMVHIIDDIWYCERDYDYVTKQANEKKEE